MSKNIVLLSDGTGNSSAKLFKTNVWRLFQALDLTDPGKQVAYYDNGVGTSSFKLFAILGGVFGFGLKRNVIAIYSFCCRNYVNGDKIYGFGFSRGAFTIRVVAAFIARMGLVTYDGNEAAPGARRQDRLPAISRGTKILLRHLRFAGARAAGLRQPQDFSRADGRQDQLHPGREISFSRGLGHRRRLWRPDRGDHARDRLLLLAAVAAGPVHEPQDYPCVPCAGAGGRTRRVQAGALGRALCSERRQASAGR